MSESGPIRAIPSDHVEPVLRLARRSLQFWPSGLAVFLVLLAIGAAATKLMPKRYLSEAVVYYREGLQWSQNEPLNPRRMGQKLKDTLLARVHLAKVVEELGLYPDLVRAGRLGEAVEEMRGATGFRFGDGDVYVISFTGRTPREAQRVTARLTDQLIAENSQLRSKQADVAREFLDSERKRKATELADKETAQLRFLAAHPEFAQDQSPTPSVGVTLRMRPKLPEGGPPAKEDGALGALLREEQRLSRQIASPGDIPPAPPDPALLAARNDAEAKLASVRRDLADRRARFTEQHPDVKMAANVLAEAEAAYKQAEAALAASREPASGTVLKKRLEKTRQEIAAYRREHPVTREPRASPVESSDAAKRIVAVETEWTRLTREVAEARERLETLDSQQFMASMTASMLAGGQAGQIVVIDPAFLPTQPVGMSLKKRLLAGLALALLFALGLAVTRALLDDVINDSVDVERLGIGPLLAEVTGAARAPEAAGGGMEPSRALAGRSLAPRELAAHEGRAAALRGGTPPPRRLEPAGRNGEAVALYPPRGDGALAANGEQRGAGAAAATAFSFVHDFAEEGRVYVHRAAGIARDARLLMLSAPDGAAAASFRVLRHRLGGRQDLKTVLVSSANAGEGKSLTAVNLALALSETGQARVLLLEANFRSPSLARLLGFLPPVCLTEQFDIHAAWPTAPWAVVETTSPSLHVAAVAPDARPRPMEGPTLAACIANLRGAGYYDYIVVDSPAILDSADVNVIEESVDGILLTLRARSSRVRSLRKAVAQVGTRKLVGLVLLEG